MSTEHKLKTLPVYFDAVVRGDKRFEVRKNDRDFQTGDTLLLLEFDPEYMPPVEPFDYTKPPPPFPSAPRMPGDYTGKSCKVKVLYALHDAWQQFGLERGYVILSISEPEAVDDASIPNDINY